ncbi:MAG: hypothetical protein ACXADO_09060 [Candidatus Thorarchaeota archaeon]|jgi:hypothetical protein
MKSADDAEFHASNHYVDKHALGLERVSENNQIDTIFDRPLGLRLIGLTQMSFGVFGLLAAVGVLIASFVGDPIFATIGPVYAVVIFVGVALPCLVIGNYVDDLRRNAVIAQIVYSIVAIGLTGFFLYNWGVAYHWTVPWLGTSFNIAIGNVAVFVLASQSVFIVYLLVRWNRVAPPPGTVIVRDRRRARLIERGPYPSPLAPSMLAPDGEHVLTPEETKRILDVRRVTTDEGMAILCSNCGGATPLTEMEDDNTIHCAFCGVRLAVSGVFVPCENHPEYLAATSCAVCGDHFCRRCLTAQDPPVDERWQGSSVYLCRKCFEGRYRPAVTTTSLVLPIEDLFGRAGGRFSRVGKIYRRFLGAYGNSMGYVFRASLQLAGSFAKAGGKGGGDDAAGIVIVIIIAIIAIPVLVGVLMLLGAIVIIPILFYAGLVGVTIEAVRIIRRTDFMSLELAREKGLVEGRPVEVKESVVREEARPWEEKVWRVQQSERESERARMMQQQWRRR